VIAGQQLATSREEFAALRVWEMTALEVQR